MIKLGEKIKLLRKQRNISQEVLANYLGVSFQAVSKWETEAAMPDVTLIPAIASFFQVSTDELFDFNIYMVEKNVEAIVIEYRKWDTDKVKSEQILREGLKKYPGNDVLLNCLVEVLPVPERASEVIDLCKTLIEGTKCAEVKYDVCRILAGAYKSVGAYSLAKETIEKIPEIYFTKLEVAAELLEGEDMFEPAVNQKWLSFEGVIHMCELLADYYIAHGEKEKAIIQLDIAEKMIYAIQNDFETQNSPKIYDVFSPRIEKYKAIRESIV